MNNLIHLQQTNFLEIQQASHHGWEVLAEPGLLALKNQAKLPLVNFVWGLPDTTKIARIKEFYGQQAYCWLSQDAINADDLPDFTDPIIFPEMALDLSTYTAAPLAANIDVIVPRSKHDLQRWAETASATLGFDHDDFINFFSPIIKMDRCMPFLALYDGEPAATSMVYCGSNAAGIYAMSTKAAFRRQGLGSAVANACCALAQQHNLRYATLYSSEMGQALYRHLGFKVTQTLYEYSLNP